MHRNEVLKHLVLERKRGEIEHGCWGSLLAIDRVHSKVSESYTKRLRIPMS